MTHPLSDQHKSTSKYLYLHAEKVQKLAGKNWKMLLLLIGIVNIGVLYYGVSSRTEIASRAAFSVNIWQKKQIQKT